MRFVEYGLYLVKDSFFSSFGTGHWMDNKQEHRPYYYMFLDSDGTMWMIPLSSQVENYKGKIQREEEKRGKGNCIYYHIGLVASKERAFLIGDMFPVTSQYIRAPFYIKGIHYISRNKNLNSELHTKAMKFMNLVKTGKIKSRNDIMGIKKQLMNPKATKRK